MTLATLAVTASPFTHPGSMDAYYYYHVASNLAQGRGLVENFIWNYLSDPKGLPQPSNLYWMPLASFVATPFLWAFGDYFRAAQVGFVLLASLAPAMSAWLVSTLWRSRSYAVWSALFTLLSGFYLGHWVAVDSFAPFFLASTVSLFMMALLVTKDKLLPAVVCGLAAGLSHLARADGALLLPTLAATLLLTQPWRRGLALFAIGLAAYLLVISPWFLRNWGVIGSPMPSSGAQTVLLREYNDLFSYNKEITLSAYLQDGLWPIALGKVRALGQNLVILYGGAFYLVPFGALGLWLWRYDRRLLPFAVYTILLYIAMSLVFTYPGVRGGMKHSGVALLPWTAAAATHGMYTAVAWVGDRLPHWDVPKARFWFTAIALIFSAFLGLYTAASEARIRDVEHRRYEDLAAWFRDQTEPEAVIMVTNPPAFHYSSRRTSIVTPSDGLDALLAAAERYGVSYLALDADHAPSLDPLYREELASPRLRAIATVGDTRIYEVLRAP